MVLSGSSNPADKTKIASVFWPVMSRDWNPNPEQKSANTALIAGTKYYFEAIMKQSDGSDNLSIGWTGPGISTITVIGGENIDRYVSGSTAADKNIISQKSIKLHPNPAKTELYISGNLSENTNYEITSIEGKSLQTGVFRGGSVSISNLMSGIYLIKIKTEAGENVQRFVKE